jgi:hypothetical protein
MFGSCEDLGGSVRQVYWEGITVRKVLGTTQVRGGPTHLITSRILASMDPLSLLCFTDTMRGGSICERGFQRHR